MRVAPSAKTRDISVPSGMPASRATVVPSAAICAKARSTKITSRAMTCSPR